LRERHLPHYAAIDPAVMANISVQVQSDPSVNQRVKDRTQAYADGSDIHLAPGKERHLGHELAHVVQQKQG